MTNEYQSLKFGGEITPTMRTRLEELITEINPDSGDLETGIQDWHSDFEDYDEILLYCRQTGIAYDYFEECHEDGGQSRGTWIFRPGMPVDDLGVWRNHLVGDEYVLLTTEQMQVYCSLLPQPATVADLANSFRQLQERYELLVAPFPPLVFINDK